jgi:GNAT superfamily N-acetyltransferase
MHGFKPLMAAEGGCLMDTSVVIRDAQIEDLAELAALKKTSALHRDRMREAQRGSLRYLVAEVEGEVVGFGVLVFTQPATWPEMKHLPQMIDLLVRPDLRSRGIGRVMIARMEELAREAGFTEMLLGVDPINNPAACRLYERLGYLPIDPKPVEDRWEFTDSDGNVHSGVNWIVHMKKPLTEEAK